MEIVDCDVFRVTRDADLEVSDDAADLLQAVEDELRRRRFGEVVRVEVGAHCSERLREPLTALLGVHDDEVYPVDGLLDMGALWQIVGAARPSPSCARSRSPASPTPRLAPATRASGPTCSGAMREGDLLVHHPYRASPARSSASSSRPSPTRTCWRSSRRSTAPATTPRSCRR